MMYVVKNIETNELYYKGYSIDEAQYVYDYYHNVMHKNVDLITCDNYIG